MSAPLRTCSICGYESLSEEALICPRCGEAVVEGRDDAPRAPEASGLKYPSCGHMVEPEHDVCPYCRPRANGQFAIEAPWGVIVLADDGLLLGRDPAFSPHADELARWDNVSRRHVVLHHDPSGVIVEDSYSTNGTYIDDVRLAPGETRLAPPGSSIRLGSDPSVELRVIAG